MIKLNPTDSKVVEMATTVTQETMAEGLKKYGNDSGWVKVSREEHIRKAIAHLELALQNDIEEPHLSHAVTRASMAMAKYLT